MSVFFICLLILCSLILRVPALYPHIYYITKIYHIPKTPHSHFHQIYPQISIVINAYKEGELIRTRVHDILSAEYPKEKISVYLVNDRDDEETGRIARDILKSNFQMHLSLFSPKMCMGKIACQNIILSQLFDEIIVFTDADVTTRQDALAKLVARLQDSEVGAVCANLIPVGSSRYVAGSEKAYRSVYGKMCEYYSQLDSIYNFNGPLIAFKKSAVPHIEEMTGADDANLALNCIANGYREVYAMNAIAYELQPISFHAQYL
jgi:cellulose synthase/poly-beta-1,6-N-acetylglucosamine synthase-like glycosyltransferase